MGARPEQAEVDGASGRLGAFDAHTHLDDPRLAGALAAVLTRARAAGVTGFAIAGADPAHWERAERVAAAAGASLALGVHPWWSADLDGPALERWLAALTPERTRGGVGETGLDFARAVDGDRRERQFTAFREHLRLARARGVPLVLHVVRAHPEARRLCVAEGVGPGVVHRFSGGPDQVQGWVKLGMMLSFGPDVLRSPRSLAAAVRCPRAHVLVETDAPDAPLTPGGVGEPADLAVVIAAIAAARGESAEELAAFTAENARRLFGA